MEKYNKRTEEMDDEEPIILREVHTTTLWKKNNGKGKIFGSIKAFKVELPLLEKLIKCT